MQKHIEISKWIVFTNEIFQKSKNGHGFLGTPQNYKTWKVGLCDLAQSIGILCKNHNWITKIHIKPSYFHLTLCR